MQIYVLRNNEQTGPFTEDEIRGQVADGTLTPDMLVWWDGLAEWQAFETTSIYSAAATSVETPAAPVTAAPVSLSAPVSTPAPSSSLHPQRLSPTEVPATQVTSALAIWSLVLGVLGFLCSIFASIPAVITGHMARGRIRRNPALKGSGLALAGLILGYFWIVIFCVAVPLEIKTFEAVYQAKLAAAHPGSLVPSPTPAPTPTTPTPQ